MSRKLVAVQGKKFEVYEIDEWGGVWVQQEINGSTTNHVSSHHLNLDSHEMEIVK